MAVTNMRCVIIIRMVERGADTLSGVFLLECHWPAVGMEPGNYFIAIPYTHRHQHHYAFAISFTTTTILPLSRRHQQNYSLLFTHTNTTIPLQPPLLLANTPPLFHRSGNTSTQCSVHNSNPPSLYIAFPSYLLARMLVRITRRTLLQRHRQLPTLALRGCS